MLLAQIGAWWKCLEWKPPMIAYDNAANTKSANADIFVQVVWTSLSNNTYGTKHWLSGDKTSRLVKLPKWIIQSEITAHRVGQGRAQLWL